MSDGAPATAARDVEHPEARAACPACEGPDPEPLAQVVTRYVPRSVNLVYWHCGQCGLVFAPGSPAAIDRLDALYVTPYRGLREEEFVRDSAGRVERNRYRQRWLFGQLRALGRAAVPGRLLEIGAKDGSFLWLCAQAGWQVQGIDPNQSYATWAREHYGVEIVPGYFRRGAFDPQAFDVVAAFHLFEHIADPPVFLRAVREVLQPHGLFYVETPNLDVLHQRHLNSGHVILYSPRSLAQVLARGGFEVVGSTERAPGGMMTFDQLAVLARPRQEPAPGPWQLADSYEVAAARITRALTDDFPNPPPRMQGRVFQVARRVLGEYAALRIGEQVQRLRPGLGRARSCREEAGSSGPMPDPLRRAVREGWLTPAHARELARIPEAARQLNALAKVRGYRLSVEATRRLVEAAAEHEEADRGRV